MQLSEKQKRLIGMALVIIAALFLIWLLYARKMLILPSAINLAPEAVRAGGTNSGNVPDYISYNVPIISPGQIGVQQQPASGALQCCAQSPQCGCTGTGGLLSTTNSLIQQYNAQSADWATTYYNQLLETAPDFLTINYTDNTSFASIQT
jgi:hypothetical protein